MLDFDNLKRFFVNLCSIICSSLIMTAIVKAEADPPLKLRLRNIQIRSGELAKEAANFWLAKAIDEKYGGFHTTLDKMGNVIPPTDKFIVHQARHLWSFSEWYARQESTQSVKNICDLQYSFITDHFLNRKKHEFVSYVSRDGSFKKDKPRLYQQAFAIYALSNYSRVFRHKIASELALACFNSIDNRAYDTIYGGYDQSGENKNKETNTQMHLIEAFTLLYDVTKDAKVRSRLNELVNIMLNRIVQPEGYALAYFKNSWEAVGDPNISYGHDLEATWLIIEAARILGRMKEKRLVKKVKKLGEISSHAGFDKAKGGYYHLGDNDGNIADNTKIWWVQAEAVLGLWWTWVLSKDHVHLDRLEGTLAWIEKHQLNASTGEWFAKLDENGRIKGTENMSHKWKSSYHTVRSMLFLENWVREYLDHPY